MKKYIVLIMWTIFYTLSYTFHIMPDSFEKRIDNGNGYQEFHFPNSSDKTIRYKFSALPGSPGRGDMSEWVEFYPRVLTIRAKETGLLRVYARSPEGTPEGEYGFHLETVPVDIPQLSKEGVMEVRASVGMKIATSLEMLGYVGNLEAKLEMLSHRVFQENGETKLEITLKNHTAKRGVEYGIEVKGRNRVNMRMEVGRIRIGETSTLVFDLKNMKEKDPYEINIFEDISYKNLVKITI